MTRVCSASFAATGHAPGQARRFLAEELARAEVGAQQLSDIAVIVSELVTNAIRAGSPTVHVRMLVEAGALRIEVRDDAGGTPTPRTVGPRATHGRGLQIVRALASGWGVEPVAGGGKVVWATVSLV